MALRNKSIILFVLIAIYFISTSSANVCPPTSVPCEQCTMCIRCPGEEFNCNCGYGYNKGYLYCDCRDGGASYSSPTAFSPGTCKYPVPPQAPGIWVGHICTCSKKI